MSTIREILDRKGGAVLTIRSQASVFEAIGIMSEANVGSVVIVDRGIPVGIFTERDYLKKIALRGRSSRETCIADVMSAPLITVAESDSGDVAMETMTACRCRHLIVLDGERLQGIVSIGDLVKQMLEEKQEEVVHLSRYIAGSY